MRLIRKDFRSFQIYYDSLTIKTIVNDRKSEDDIDEMISIKLFFQEELQSTTYLTYFANNCTT